MAMNFGDLVPQPDTPQQPATPPQATAQPQQWQPPDQSGVLGGYAALSNSLLSTATLGLSDLAGGTAAWLVDKAVSEHPPTWRQDFNRFKRTTQKEYQQHPWLSAAGTVGGLFTGGGLLAKGIEAGAKSSVPLISRIAGNVGGALDTTGQSLAVRAGKQAALGATLGGISQMADAGQLIPNVNTGVAALVGGTAGSAIGGALPTITSVAGGIADKVGGLVNKVSPDLMPTLEQLGKSIPFVTGPSDTAKATIKAALPTKGTPSSRAWGLIADKIGLKPKELQAALTNYKDATGRVPTIPEILHDSQSGALRAMADSNPQLAVALQANAARAKEAQPRNLAGLIGETNRPPALAPGTAPVSLEQIPTQGMTRTQALNDINKTRVATASAMMAPVNPLPVPVTGKFAQDVLLNPFLRKAIPDATKLGKKVAATINDLMLPDGSIAPGATTNRLTMTDIEGIRKAMQKETQVYTNPNSASANWTIGQELKGIVAQITDTGAAAHPVYKDMLTFTKNAHDYRRAFEHGSTGNSGGVVANSELSASMDTPQGVLGFRAGLANHFAHKAAASVEGAAATAHKLAQTGTSTAELLQQGMGPAAATNIQQAAAATDSANRALSISRAAPIRPPTEVPASNAVVAVAEGASGWWGASMVRAMRYLKDKLGIGRLPHGVDRKVAEYLTSRNPKKISQGIAIMTKAGVTESERAAVLHAVAGVSGATAAQLTMPDQHYAPLRITITPKNGG